jgi:hypothetical protein
MQVHCLALQAAWPNLKDREEEEDEEEEEEEDEEEVEAEPQEGASHETRLVLLHISQQTLEVLGPPVVLPQLLLQQVLQVIGLSSAPPQHPLLLCPRPRHRARARALFFDLFQNLQLDYPLLPPSIHESSVHCSPLPSYILQPPL